MVWINLSVSQLLLFGVVAGVFLTYFMYDWYWHCYHNLKECDKCHGKGYVKK